MTEQQQQQKRQQRDTGEMHEDVKRTKDDMLQQTSNVIQNDAKIESQTPKPQAQEKSQTNTAQSTQQQQPIQQSNHDQCKCGENVQFFIIEQNKHFCEKCALNEIYKNESYDQVIIKVMNKVKNIMRIRHRIFQLKQYWKQQNLMNQKHQSKMISGDTNKQEETRQQETSDNTPSANTGAKVNNNNNMQFNNSGNANNQNQNTQQQQQYQQEMQSIEELNLFYDLLQIEIEKLRRRAIDQTRSQFNPSTKSQNNMMPQQVNAADNDLGDEEAPENFVDSEDNTN